MSDVTQSTVLYESGIAATGTPIAKWNGHTFDITPEIIRGFSDMKLKAGSDTKNKTASKQKYVKREAGAVREITMTIILHAYLGVSDVYAEAMDYLSEANSGAKDYFYLGDAKLFPAKMMLTSAEVIEIVHYPGQGKKWISCKVNVTFKQASKNTKTKSSSKKKSGKKSSSSSSSKTKKSSTKTHTTSLSENERKQQMKQAKETAKNASRVSASTKSAGTNKFGGRFGTGG